LSLPKDSPGKTISEFVARSLRIFFVALTALFKGISNSLDLLVSVGSTASPGAACLFLA